MLRPLFLLFALFTCPAFAQQVGFGIKGGVRVTNDIDGSFGTSSESSRYVVGPMVEATAGNLKHSHQCEWCVQKEIPTIESVYFASTGISHVTRTDGSFW